MFLYSLLLVLKPMLLLLLVVVAAFGVVGVVRLTVGNLDSLPDHTW